MPKKSTVPTVNPHYTCIFSAVNFLRLSFFSIIFLLGLTYAQAQDGAPRRRSKVIDDTTKQIYGPRTSRYFYEQDVFFNRKKFYRIDTLITNFHRYTFVQRNNYLYQDLGNIGTPIRSIFYQTPETIGVRSGAHVYDLYWDSENVKYYDTKSPYSNMKIVLGGKGRSMTKVTFSRNINPRWNFGFTYRGLFIDKQVNRIGKGDRATRSNYYDLFTNYQSKDSSYQLFANFRRMFHRVAEMGGIRILDTATFDFDKYFDPNAQPWLKATESNDLRMNMHIFQQYSIGKGLQVYQIFDRYRQRNEFIEVQNLDSKKFYDFQEIAADSINDITKFKTVRTEVGLKGSLAKLFYNGYYAIRHYSQSYQNFTPDGKLTPAGLPHITYDSLNPEKHNVPLLGDENYFGGRMSLALDSIGEVNGWVETTTSGNYRIQGEIRSKWFEARVKQMEYAPGFVEQAYRGAHDVWINRFSNTTTSQINGYIHYRSAVFNLSPGLTLTRLKNYVFYKANDTAKVQQVLPMQSSGTQTIFSPEVRASVTVLRHISLSTQLIYSKLLENADNAIQIPEVFANTQLAYANIFFNGNMDMQGGVDLHWKSAYYALGYDPAIRQFYVQDKFLVPAYPIVDVFFNMKVKRSRIFFKYHNILQAFTKSGYLPTPYYPGQANIIDFGFDWSFYD
jgi:hypothetical protein